MLSADNIVIATGTRPARPATVEFDERTILDSDNVLNLERVPRSMVIVGAGVIGMEYASMFAALGSKITVVEQRDRMLDFCDVEVIESLKYHLRDLAVTFRFGETVAAVERHPRGTLTVLESGKRIAADAVMYSAGRQGAHRRARPGQGRACPPTGAAGSRSTSTTAPRCRTSTPSATSSASRRWPRPRWSRGARRPTTRAASR